MRKLILAVTDFQLNGYELISPVFGKNPLRISEYVDDGESSEIICDNILSYCPTEQMLHYITALSKKLVHGGQLTFTGIDALLLCEALIRGEINIINYNELLFGLHQHAWQFKMSAINLYDIEDMCKGLGLKIKEKSINGYNYIIKVERP
jgi:hypothetical protein